MDLMARRRAIMGMPSGKDYTVTGNVVSISNALAKNAKSAIVTFLPKQSGSGDPSPNNVRPITGYNDIGAVRYGKNIFNKDGTDTSEGYVAGKYLTYVGEELAPGSGSFAISEYIPILPNTAYTVSGLPTSNSWSPSICQYDSSHVFITGLSYQNAATKTFTSGANAAYVRMSIPTVNINSLQLEYGSSATSYESYISSVTANVHSDTTIFGGTVDLVSGVCQLNGMLETFNMDNGTTISSQLNSFAKNSTGVGTIGSYTRISFAVRGDVDQTQYNRASNTYATPLCNYAKHYFAYNSESTHWYRNGTMYLFLPTSVVGSTGQSVYDYLVSIMNTEPLSAWVELATPITYQLTPSQLAMLKGNNTVYSNEGSISLTYVGK